MREKVQVTKILLGRVSEKKVNSSGDGSFFAAKCGEKILS